MDRQVQLRLWMTNRGLTGRGPVVRSRPAQFTRDHEISRDVYTSLAMRDTSVAH